MFFVFLRLLVSEKVVFYCNVSDAAFSGLAVSVKAIPYPFNTMLF
jgi:hypothetical protein